MKEVDEMRFDLVHPAEQLIMIMDRIYKYGMTTTSGGNLSIRDEDGDIWITPSGIDKGTLTVEDIIQVKADGTIIGKHKPSCELPFHQSTYRMRPDITAVLHAHSPALVSFSIVRRLPDTKLIPNAALIFGEVGLAEYGLPGSEDLGCKISEVFKQGINTVLLENHGAVVVGEDLYQAFMVFETLDFCARMEIAARRIGKPIALTAEDIDMANSRKNAQMQEFIPLNVSSDEKKARKMICEMVHRSYDQMLFTSTQGAVSTRLEDGSFLITPDLADRKYLDTKEIVRIEQGKKEAGKVPDSLVSLHQSIYSKHSHINTIITAQPPNIMAFSVTREKFDSRTIPESYIVLRNIPKLPFESSYIHPDKIAEIFKKDTPIVLIDNDSIIVTGNSLINAFDRLEVAEYSAKALIDSKVLGDVVIINDEQIDEIEEAFDLK